MIMRVGPPPRTRGQPRLVHGPKDARTMPFSSLEHGQQLALTARTQQRARHEGVITGPVWRVHAATVSDTSAPPEWRYARRTCPEDQRRRSLGICARLAASLTDRRDPHRFEHRLGLSLRTLGPSSPRHRRLWSISGARQPRGLSSGRKGWSRRTEPVRSRAAHAAVARGSTPTGARPAISRPVSQVGHASLLNTGSTDHIDQSQ
jgi:hypothetical protein